MHPERQFYFRLAEVLGCTVAELLERISSRELTEWVAYYRIEAKRTEMERQKHESLDRVRRGRWPR